MSSRFSHTSSFTKLIIIIEFLLVGYLVYSLTKNVYNSYQVDNYIDSFKSENAAIESDNRQKNEDYLYFTSEQYIDKIAKQNLGLVNAGEEVIILSSEAMAEADLEVYNDGLSVAKYSGLSNLDQWWEFFFGN